MSDMDEFENKFIRGGSGKFWKPAVVGDKIFGKIVKTGESKLGIYFVIQTSDGEQISLPSHKVIANTFKRYGIGIGDTVLIKYDGLSEKAYFGGKHAYIYSVSAQHPDGTWVVGENKEAPEDEEPEEPSKPEAPKVEAPKPEESKVEAEKKPRKKKGDAPKEEAPKPSEPAKAAEDSPKKDEEVKHFIGQLIKFFGEISMPDLEKYISDRNFGLSVDSVITLCGLDIIEKDGKKFVRKVT